MKKILLIILISPVLWAQSSAALGWQQEANYNMGVTMDVKTFRYKGSQVITYTNHSPDTLKQVFYHLFFNAFQPGSEMDVRSRNISDPDPRVGSRIAELSENEIGYLRVSNLTQDGAPLSYEEEETILSVRLNKALLPGQTTLLRLDFDGQVPKQIRRSGRNNKEGVALSMTQWYPKLAEYDHEGWHANAYIGREFHGVWGNYNVAITLDKDYVVGGTGYLQNPEEVGHGYAEKTKKTHSKNLTWLFNAPNVHDFAWAADPDYLHDVVDGPSGVKLHFLYKNDPEIIENWKKLQEPTVRLMAFFNKHIGPYPWKQYSVIQGGDGGMEYAMCTLITGKRSFGSLFGVTAHEMAHAWFQHVLATNESKHEWMDEGFTSYISSLAENEILDEKQENPFLGYYRGYYALVASGMEQPLSTHADRYAYNRAYGVSAYSKGAVFLAQLGYVIGHENLQKTLHRYFKEFGFKHPTPNDFKRVAEKVSGIQLDWYLIDWTQTTNTIDYAIEEVSEKEENQTEVLLKRNGQMPMPIDLVVVYKDGSFESFYIPLRMMRGEKKNPYGAEVKRTVLEDWPWAYPDYKLHLDKPLNQIKGIYIDPSGLMADVESSNNAVEF